VGFIPFDAVWLFYGVLVLGWKYAVVKIFNATLAFALILLGAIASDSTFAARGHSGRSGHSAHSGGVARLGHSGHHARIGIFLGAPVFAPMYYPPSGYYYDPSPPTAPPVYIEQEPASPEPAQQPYYWYYCADSKTYYPYVSDCPGGWQQVVPQTPPPS
jgi:hypothetical protein